MPSGPDGGVCAATNLKMQTIAFVLIGGRHQFPHGAPVVAALSLRGDCAVEAYVRDEGEAGFLRLQLDQLGAGAVRIIPMRLPTVIEYLAGRSGGPASLKLLRLVWWSHRLRKADVIVALERTSALLKRLPGDCPPMVQIPHGAGDRAKGYDRRFRLFDRALVAGEKDRQRLIQLGLMKPEQVTVTGYVKRAGLQRMHGFERPKLFANSRPIILYNPHFDSRLSSMPRLGRAIVDAVADDDRFNLIVAPHVRLFAVASAHERAEWEALAQPDRVLVDLGSERSIDMSYTLGADIYLGDVSSQVYEFCTTPRPCVFVNAHGADWRDDPNYAMWHLGQVVSRADEVIPAIDHALAFPEEFTQEQREAVLRSFGDSSLPADEIAADSIAAMLRDVSRSSGR